MPHEGIIGDQLNPPQSLTAKCTRKHTTTRPVATAPLTPICGGITGIALTRRVRPVQVAALHRPSAIPPRRELRGYSLASADRSRVSGHHPAREGSQT
jgi:hypothetical protein